MSEHLYWRNTPLSFLQLKGEDILDHYDDVNIEECGGELFPCQVVKGKGKMSRRAQVLKLLG